MTETPESSRAGWRRLEELNSPRLASNLALIQQLAPELFDAIQENRGGESLWVQPQGGVMRCRVEGGTPAWVFGETNPRQELALLRETLSAIPVDADLLVLLGGMMGYALQGAARLVDQGKSLLLIESSAARLRAALILVDLRPLLASGRVFFHIAQPSVEGVLAAVERYNLWSDKSPAVAYTDGFPEGVDVNRLREAFREESERAQRFRIETLNATQKRPRNAGVLRRAWLMDCWPLAPQTLHIQQIEDVLRRLGVETERFTLQGLRFDLHPEAYRREIEAKLLHKAKISPPDLVVSYAYHAPNIIKRDFYESLAAPWVQVVSNIAYYDTDYYPGEATAIVERKLIPVYRRRGATRPFFVPIMADYVADQPASTSREIPIVFVGNSLGMAPQQVHAFFLRLGDRKQLVSAVREAEAALSDFNRGLNLYDYLEAHPLPQIQDEKEEFEAFRYLLCQTTAARRRDLLERLAPLGLALYGTWEHTLPPDSPLRGCLRGTLPMRREPELFARGAAFINIHSTGHVTGPNMRFFNVAGMGGLSLSDGAFGEFLEPGTEYVGFASANEMIEQARYLLAHPHEADEIRAKGWERVRREWTYHRWVQLVTEELGLELPGEYRPSPESTT